MTRFSPSTVRPVATAAAALLGLVGAVHAAWATGITWPFEDKKGLARTVVNVPAAEMPSGILTLTIAALVWAAAFLILAKAAIWRTRLPGWVPTVGTYGVSVVLFLRALMGLESIGVDSTYARLDVALYSPLCLLLAVLAAVVALTAPTDTAAHLSLVTSPFHQGSLTAACPKGQVR